jgi:hypothetical protein
LPVLGIIACGMLEDELAHVLCSDSGVRHLLLIDSPEILGLARKLRSRNRSHLIVSQEAVPDLLADIMKGRSRGFLTLSWIRSAWPFWPRQQTEVTGAGGSCKSPQEGTPF